MASLHVEKGEPRTSEESEPGQQEFPGLDFEFEFAKIEDIQGQVAKRVKRAKLSTDDWRGSKVTQAYPSVRGADCLGYQIQRRVATLL